MSIINLKDNIYWVGVKNPELRVFDIIMETKKGTTYNAYLVNDEKVAIVDTVKNGYFDEYLANIKSVIGDKKVDYIIVQHTELDHSGSIAQLIEEYPDAKVLGTRAALMYIKEIINADFNCEPVPAELSLGSTTLKFIQAPNLHWPDTMFTYATEQNVLFTCDVLGCHFCPEEGITEKGKEYLAEMKYYFDVIMGPFKKFVIAGLDKIKDLKLDIVAPSHGPIHKDDIEQFAKLYREWATVETPKEKNVQIFYISAYGNTEKVARHMAEKISNMGIRAEASEITTTDMNEIIERIDKSTGFMIGSPTINQDAVKPAWDVLSLVSAIVNRGKTAAAFGSYGWSGEGVPMLTQRMKSLKLSVPEEGLRFKFVPGEKDFKRVDEFVEMFIGMLK